MQNTDPDHEKILGSLLILIRLSNSSFYLKINYIGHIRTTDNPHTIKIYAAFII
jgi:hypothetical protein